MLSKSLSFQKARPVWGEGLAEEKNVQLLFCTRFAGSTPCLLRVAAAGPYQIFVNGRFLHYGPARAGHGFFRVDEVDLTPYLARDNRLEISCVAYGVNSYVQVDALPFVAAELVRDGTVIAATGTDAFTAYRYTPRIQKIQRYSFQRPFAEAYDFHRAVEEAAPIPLCEVRDARVFLERGVALPLLERADAKAVLCRGKVGLLAHPPKYDHAFITAISPALQGFPAEELERCTVWEAQKLSFTVTDAAPYAGNTLDLPENGFGVLDMGRNLCGFPAMTVTCDTDVTLYLLFDEILGNNDPNQLDFTRLDVSGVIVYDLPAGTHGLLAFEPSVFRYLRIACLGGGCRIEQIHLRRLGAAEPAVRLQSDDPRLQAVFTAAVETYRENALDIFMDCASRERAGWLCDSFFTARSERTLTGDSKIERNFLENFILPPAFPHLPEGMLPMCYPAEHKNGNYIPNWAMWYVLELEEYLGRTGDRELVERAKDKLYGLLAFFRQYENADGLLEKLPAWVFVEWSKANEFVQDVNFPSNMLYARMLQAMAALYGDEALAQKARALTDTIRRLSFNGQFFRDRMTADRDGRLTVTEDITEVCQYYAFFTGVATPDSHPRLWNTLLTQFGPARRETGAYPEIWPANSFVGNYLRLELLLTYDYREELLDNMKGYLYYMAERTGTLWENDGAYASCSHGFASHAVYWLDQMGLLKKQTGRPPLA